ncbi:MAG: type I 3-dehydroquinate dehydratase [Bacteroidales bacterium]
MICLSITSSNFEQCQNLLQGSRMAELRLDLMQLPLEQVQALLQMGITCVVTCRPCTHLSISPLAYLRYAIQQGAKYVDIELEASEEQRLALIAEARKYGCRVILSYHNFSGTPCLEDLRSIVAQCRAMGADIVKLITTAQHSHDVARLLSLYEGESNLIAFAMGALGQISRFACLHLGAAFTYVSADKETEAAPAQLTQSQAQSLIALLPPINFSI